MDTGGFLYGEWGRWPAWGFDFSLLQDYFSLLRFFLLSFARFYDIILTIKV